MVHSNFYYPKIEGSQFIVDRLCEGLNIYSELIENINIKIIIFILIKIKSISIQLYLLEILEVCQKY